ncbi:ABC transporter substrate-binding protein [Pyrofollis japonicus]|uniref:ABC transporter substrate-binding protein n=1 Tax=Pyrofollis japonicus TaxID=3060460 RepID=UPI00295B5EC0|nr:ABC transporter substrate-binding protein [Pyrofollis japonicus]BEP17417.1 ABC transporter substrate-binding protein [Pyrofollis japonicus]
MASRTGLITATVIVILIIIGVAAYYASKGGGKTTTTPATTTQPQTTQPATSTPQEVATTTSKPPATTTTPQTSTPPPATTTAPAKASTIIIGTTDKVTDLDPANAYDFFTWEVLTNTMDTLVKYKPGTDQIVPAIAEKWEVKNNGTVWIFHLRKDVKFCDGTPVTAKDVVRSIKRVMTIKGDPSWLVTSFVKDVKALDDYTVEFDLKHPTGFFLALLATPPYAVVSPKYPNDKIVSDATWGGAGPYCIKEFKRDEYLVLEANPYYYGEKPKTQKVIIRFYKDATTLRLALENGEIDIAWRTLRPNDYQELKQSGKFNVIEIPGTFIRYIVVNVKMEPTNNKLVRQAIAAAINRKQLAQIVFMGTMEPLYSLVPKGLWSHKDVFLEKYGDGNIELAKKLLQQAGYSKDHKLKLELWYTPTHYGDTEADLAQLIKQQLEATGMITVEIKSSEWATYVDQLRKGQMMLALLGWYPDYIDPDDFLTPFLHSEANKWTGSGYSNPEVDKLLDEAVQLTDQQARAKLYEKVQEILAEDVPIIPLLQGKLFIVTQKNVEGVKVGPTMLLPYYTIYKTTS